MEKDKNSKQKFFQYTGGKILKMKELLFYERLIRIFRAKLLSSKFAVLTIGYRNICKSDPISFETGMKCLFSMKLICVSKSFVHMYGYTKKVCPYIEQTFHRLNS